MFCALKMNLFQRNDDPSEHMLFSLLLIFVITQAVRYCHFCNLREVGSVALAELKKKKSTVTGFELHRLNQASAHHMALCAILFWFTL